MNTLYNNVHDRECIKLAAFSLEQFRGKLRKINLTSFLFLTCRTAKDSTYPEKFHSFDMLYPISPMLIIALGLCVQARAYAMPAADAHVQGICAISSAGAPGCKLDGSGLQYACDYGIVSISNFSNSSISRPNLQFLTLVWRRDR